MHKSPAPLLVILNEENFYGESKPVASNMSVESILRYAKVDGVRQTTKLFRNRKTKTLVALLIIFSIG